MNIYAVGDSLLVEAFELIGIPGHVVKPHEDEVTTILAALAKECEVILLQSPHARQIPSHLCDELASKFNCLVVEVPGIGEPAPDSGPLLQSIRSSLGATK